MALLETAIKELRTIVAADCTAPEWRWNVRRRLSSAREALDDAQVVPTEAWLAARTRLSDRDRFRLQARINALSSGAMDRLAAGAILHETKRLLGDLERHRQREHDLVYDSVSLELGGSE